MEVLPAINQMAAEEALALVDCLVKKQKDLIDEADKSSMKLARLIADVSNNGYWMIRGYKSEGTYIEDTFPGSRSQYYILKRVGDKLRPYPEAVLEEIGISKCQDLIRIHDHCGGAIPNEWFILAKEVPRDQFRLKVRAYVGKALPAPQEEEDLYVNLRIWPEAKPVWNLAMEIMARECGSDKSVSHKAILMAAEIISGHNEEGQRVKGMYSMAINTIKLLITSMKGCPDPTVWDRLIGAVREGLEEAKE